MRKQSTLYHHRMVFDLAPFFVSTLVDAVVDARNPAVADGYSRLR